ncbi:hypothetical protein H8D57_01785, partial [bacterium]|nr:hypothetical protein [bacterium]
NEGNGEWVHNDIIGKFELFGGSGGGLWLEEDFAYFCINQLGIVICGFGYDGPFNNPINPYLIGKVDTPGAARDIKLNEAGTIAVIADYQAGITLIDISEKSNPKVISSFLPARVDQVEKIFVVNNQAYFIDTNNGLFVADISDPELPFLSGRYDTPDPENLFVTSDEIIFLADQDLGLIVLEWR